MPVVPDTPGVLAAAVAASSSVTGLTALVAAVAGLVSAVLGSTVTYLVSRRTNSGNVNTSPAEVIFAQLQQMYTSTEARAERAEGQRDKLIDSQGTSVAPALEEINRGLSQMLMLIEQLAATQRHIEANQTPQVRPHETAAQLAPEANPPDPASNEP